VRSAITRTLLRTIALPIAQGSCMPARATTERAASMISRTDASTTTTRQQNTFRTSRTRPSFYSKGERLIDAPSLGVSDTSPAVGCRVAASATMHRAGTTLAMTAVVAAVVVVVAVVTAAVSPASSSSPTSSSSSSSSTSSSSSASSGSKGPLDVWLVPHSHDDVGWLLTVDEYYVQQVRWILDTVVPTLQADPRRRFTIVEVAYLRRWWDEQSNGTRAAMRDLVARGQLDFTLGGWCVAGQPLSPNPSVSFVDSPCRCAGSCRMKRRRTMRRTLTR
jgi:hypothetical protein